MLNGRKNRRSQTSINEHYVIYMCTFAKWRHQLGVSLGLFRLRFIRLYRFGILSKIRKLYRRSHNSITVFMAIPDRCQQINFSSWSHIIGDSPISDKITDITNMMDLNHLGMNGYMLSKRSKIQNFSSVLNTKFVGYEKR